MLKPTAEMLGIELRDYIKGKIQPIKEETKAENVKVHLEAVAKKIKNNDETDSYGITQLELFSDWMEHSGNVDPQDEELATLWQNLLVETANRKPNSSLVLEKLKHLQPEDAHVLNKFGNKSDKYLTEEDRYRLSKLEELGLIETNETNIMIMRIGMISSFIAVLLFTLFFNIGGFFEYFPSFGKGPPYIHPFATFGQLTLFWLPVIVYLLVFIVLIRRYRKNGFFAKFNTRLTWLGKRILTLGQ